MAAPPDVPDPPQAPVVVTDYDPRWPALFEILAAPVREAVSDLGAEVQHVGSTSVPGLAAKPVIDIDVVVRSRADVSSAIERLGALGYIHQGEQGIAGREAFISPDGARPHHLYGVVAGTSAHCDHVDFRDHLRAHPDTARDYAQLKRGLAVEYRDDRDGYADAKAGFVTEVLQRARLRGS